MSSVYTIQEVNQFKRVKGEQLPHVQNKLELFNRGEDILCPRHGLHKKWVRYINHGKYLNVACSLCSLRRSTNYRKKYPIRRMLAQARERAKNGKIEFNLNEDELRSLLKKQNNECALSGMELVKEKNNPLKMSLDKIDSNKGYTIDNVQILGTAINRMKSDLNQDEFLKICKNIVENQLVGHNIKRKMF